MAPTANDASLPIQFLFCRRKDKKLNRKKTYFVSGGTLYQGPKEVRSAYVIAPGAGQMHRRKVSLCIYAPPLLTSFDTQ